MPSINAVTRSYMEILCRPGYVITVQYLRPDMVASVIGFAENGKATHALCCLGGLDIVEATALGVFETNLHNYLRGNCRLTIRSANPLPTTEQAAKATAFWNERVLDPYDWRMIFGTTPIVLLRHTIGLFSRGFSDWAVRHMPNLLASNSLSTCAELAAKGLRQFTLVALKGYYVENVDPEILRIDSTLTTISVLDAPVLVD